MCTGQRSRGSAAAFNINLQREEDRSVLTALLILRACSGELPSLPPDSLLEGHTKVEQQRQHPPTAALPHLGHRSVDLQNLLVTFDLSHADFAGELGGGRAVSLQPKGTVQGLLVAAPHLREGEFLSRQRRKQTKGRQKHAAMQEYALNEIIHQVSIQITFRLRKHQPARV